MDTVYNGYMNEFHIPHHLPIDLTAIGFVEREHDRNGNVVKNRCGRDFLYYALNYLQPEVYSPSLLNPVRIEQQGIFGVSLPAHLVWTGLTFKHVPSLLKKKGLHLSINSRPIRTYVDFMCALIFSRPQSLEDALETIQKNIDAGNIIGIDIAVRLGGLVDHVMFVYGYDAENLYVCDTRQTPHVPFIKITPPDDRRYLMKLPYREIAPRWNRLSRIWKISRI